MALAGGELKTEYQPLKGKRPRVGHESRLELCSFSEVENVTDIFTP